MNTAMSTATAPGVRRGWDADGGWSTADAAGTVLVIDSWLVDEGRARGLHRHAQCFEGLGRFQDTDAAVAERRQSSLAALAVPAGASLIPVVNP